MLKDGQNPNLCYTIKNLFWREHGGIITNKAYFSRWEKEPADLVIKHAQIVNVFTKEILTGDVAICDGKIVGIGQYEGKEIYDAKINTSYQDLLMGMCISKVHFYLQASLQKFLYYMASPR